MSTIALSATSMVCSGTEPSASGGRLGTITRKLWTAFMPPGSVAVNVMVAVPLAVATTVRTDPSIDALNTLLSAATV